MRQASEDLKLDRLIIIHAGLESYELSEGVMAIAAARIINDLKR